MKKNSKMEPLLRSHKDKLLKNHLKEVGENSKAIIQEKLLNLELIQKKDLANVSYLIGISHDFGKSTSFFQGHLNGKKRILHEWSQHSLISAFFAYFLIGEYCNENNLNKIFSCLGAFLIKRHHGNLDSIIDTFKFDDSYSNKNRKALIIQLEDVKKNIEIKEIYSELLKKFNIEIIQILERLERFISGTKPSYEFEDEIFSLIDEINKDNLSYELFLISELLFSVLVDSDKKDAAGILLNDPLNNIIIPNDSVQKYIKLQKEKNPDKFNPENEKDKRIVELKNKVFNDCVNNLKISPEKHIYSITAPTGIGKTYTSLATALRLKEKIFEQISKDFKIHYLLPFTTIIDQNYVEFYNILRENCDNFDLCENDYILKHHYLTDFNLKKRSECNKIYTSKSYFDDLLFVRSWDSKLVVSSYVQLMHTIIGGKNSFMNKFHNIINSIIILDEVQCISLKYWELVRDIFSELAEKFNVYFIFLTATQPMIFNKKDEITELSDLSIFQEPILDRVKIIDEKQKDLTVKEFYNLFKKYEQTNPQDRYLFVLNTKRSSLNLYNEFTNEKENCINRGFEIFYLSTNLTKYDRDDKLKRILGEKDKEGRYIKGKEPLKKYILITTQLIEAGVDISSDVCYRDVSPIDSIIQTAGRVNRFGEKDSPGELHIISIKEEKEGGKVYFPKTIYNSSILTWTEETLENKKNISSKDFQRLCEDFYLKFLNEKGLTKEHSQGLIKDIKNLNFNKILESFKFIEEYPTHSIFISNSESKKIINRYKEVYRNKPKTNDSWSIEMQSWKGDLKKLRNKFNSFIIELTPRDFSKNLSWLKNDIKELGEEFFYIDIQQNPKLYNGDTGFNLDYELDNFC